MYERVAEAEAKLSAFTRTWWYSRLADRARIELSSILSLLNEALDEVAVESNGAPFTGLVGQADSDSKFVWASGDLEDVGVHEKMGP